VVVGDDEVSAAAGADVFGAAVEESGLEGGVDAEAVGGAALESCGDLLEWGEGFGVGAHVEGGDMADEGAENGVPAPGAELGAGPVGEGCGQVEPRRRLRSPGHGAPSVSAGFAAGSACRSAGKCKQ
jgi:hypothetical protein